MIDQTKITGVLKQLNAVSGTNAKLEVLKSVEHDADIKEFLRRTYEPTINYYLTYNSKLPVGGSGGTKGLEDAYAFLDDLSSRKLTGNAARATYAEIVACLDPESADLLNTVLKRDIRCGIAETQINKIWPGLITTTPYMRCSLPETSKIKKWNWGQPGFLAYSQRKEDGMFANLTQTSRGWVVSSRSGSIFPPSAVFTRLGIEAEEVALNLMKDSAESSLVQFHGELLVFHKNVVMPREKGNGVLNSILQKGEYPGADYEVGFVCWDSVPVSAVNRGRYEIPYSDRFEELTRVVESRPDLVTFKLVESRRVVTYEQASAHFLELTARGDEGTIVKRADAPWFDGDSLLQVKMKVVFEVDLRIIKFNPGNGKNASTFGSIYCESECGGLGVSVSGFTDAKRKELWEAGESIVGKIMAVAANNVMAATNGGKQSLFLPRYVEIRADKTTADDVQRILDQFSAAMQGA